MEFRQTQKVLFKHCDPAGIVFYPRYFEIMNDCVEAFFDHIGFAFEDLHKTHAVPTVRIETSFRSPSRHGDMLTLGLRCKNIGRTSLSIEITTACEGETRLVFDATLVHIDGSGAPAPWPEALRQAFLPYQQNEA